MTINSAEKVNRSCLYASQIILLSCLFLTPASTFLGNILYYITAIIVILCSHKRVLHFAAQHKISYAFWGFGLLIILSIIYSKAPFMIAAGTAKKYLWLIITPFFFYIFNTKKMITLSERVFLVAMLITLLLSYAKATHLIEINLIRDKAGIFKDHIIQSFLMVFAAAILLSKVTKQYKYRYYYLALAALFLINVLCFSDGRFGYFLVIALLVFWSICYFKLKKAFMIIAVVIIIVLFALVASPTLKKETKRTLHSAKIYLQQKHNNDLSHPAHNTSLAIRINESKRCLRHINASNIIQGLGSGGISTVFNPGETYSKKAHALVDSGYINMLMQRGLIGVLYFIFFIAALWYQSFGLPKEYKLQLRFLLISIVFGMIFNTWLTETTISHLFSIYVVVLLSTRKLMGKTNEQQNLSDHRHL